MGGLCSFSCLYLVWKLPNSFAHILHLYRYSGCLSAIWRTHFFWDLSLKSHKGQSRSSSSWISTMSDISSCVCFVETASSFSLSRFNIALVAADTQAYIHFQRASIFISVLYCTGGCSVASSDSGISSWHFNTSQSRLSSDPSLDESTTFCFSTIYYRFFFWKNTLTGGQFHKPPELNHQNIPWYCFCHKKCHWVHVVVPYHLNYVAPL